MELTVSTLQWGRDHLIAEITTVQGAPRPFRTLQWGRDHLIAEMTWRAFSGFRARLTSFNGAAII